MDERALAAAGFHAAPLWSTAVGVVGRGSIILSVLCFGACLGFGLLKPAAERWTRWSFWGGCAGLFSAFINLGTLFAFDQFQYEYVAGHSWRETSLPYKLAAIWAGQQGSFLLWACCSALFGLLTIRGAAQYRRTLVNVFSAFLLCLSSILTFETPFGILPKMVQGGTVYIPLNGLGLVPSLQNYWVVIHPPTIFLGFGSLTVMFAYAVAAMVTGDVEGWVPKVRPWALLSLTILGLGLVMGGLWAYETQGWGGFWAWDPVENVSFVPWLMGAALIHGLMVQVTRKKWHSGNLLLAGAPFLLFVYGTFLTRSGYLDKFSVHSFAQMNRTALWFLLSFLVFAMSGFLGLWWTKGRSATRKVLVSEETNSSPRETGFTGGVILLSVLAVSVGLGMSVPFLYGLLGKDAKVVDEPLYHQVVVWFFIPIMLFMSIVPFLSWRKSESKGIGQKFWGIIGIAVLLQSLVMFGLHLSNWHREGDAPSTLTMPFGVSVPRAPLVVLLCFLTCVAVAANAWRVAELYKRSKMGIGGFVAHIGVAVTLGGLIVSRGLEQKQQILVMEGTSGKGLGYSIAFKRMTGDPAKDNHNRAIFEVTPGSGTSSERAFEAQPAYYLTPGEGNKVDSFTTPAIEHTLTHDVYLALETPQTNLWDQPQTFAVGETKEGSGVSITYIGLVQHGQPGAAGTSFGAKLKVVEDGVEYFGEPKLSLDSGADTPQVSPSLRATLDGMDAADHSIRLQMPYTHILFPIQMFYKPMTILIWIGLFLMTIGGLLAAWYRRPATQ